MTQVSTAALDANQDAPAATFQLPVAAVIFRADGLRVAKVVNGRVSLVPVTLGRDFGASVEVVDGVTGSDQIVATPSDSLSDGTIVRIASTE